MSQPSQATQHSLSPPFLPSRIGEGNGDDDDDEVPPLIPDAHDDQFLSIASSQPVTSYDFLRSSHLHPDPATSSVRLRHQNRLPSGDVPRTSPSPPPTIERGISLSTTVPALKPYYLDRSRASAFTLGQPLLYRQSPVDYERAALYGYVLLISIICMCLALIYALIVSKLVGPTNFWWLNIIVEDQYYCLLIPVTGVVIIQWVFLNWLGMKFFRHN
ncbi:hypothetical protein EV182_000410 [Spiromyces aspiralis]|uniref:Uncharacterized protein n=1 Tax=Spiromyces aspiralis TaxID=68401 RepID=A0ACC1HUI7_9FUNG|nr:hypothetical protein EV182_000410 [Spiromyces aspiralis]